ncbi:MAG: hypothetical protein OZ934_01305 [Anaerolineae bacterium]|nr:hypothetical protein [Anaerolineae bacterium]
MPVRPRLPAPRVRAVVALIALLALAGLALRLGLLVRAGWRYDYDEGMVGLQVLRILRGVRPVFHPGQPYLAALESYLIAPFFAAFGASAVTLKLVPWLLAGVYTAATGWLGWRAFDRRVGALSALLAACAPSYLLITGMKAWGATAETLALGTLSLIAATYIVEEEQPPAVRARALIVLGFLGGVGFWVSWLIVFYALPIAVILAWRGRETLRRAGWIAGLAFALGSAPLWGYNLGHNWATFRYLLRSQGDTWGNLRPVLDHLTYDLAPRLVSGDPRWPILSWDAVWWLQIVYEGGLATLVLWAWRGPWPRAHRPARALLALFALTLPPIYLLSGYGNHALNEFGFDATGRYVLMLHSALPIGAAALGVWLARRGSLARVAAAGVLTSVIGLNLLGALRTDPLTGFASPYYIRQPQTLEPLIALLDEEGIRHVWTDVGIAHVLMFETRERILAADWYDIYGAEGLVRFPEVPQRIYEAERVAFVEVVLPGQDWTRFEQAFRDAGIPYRRVRITPDLLVIIPRERIDPALVGDGLGYQF